MAPQSSLEEQGVMVGSLHESTHTVDMAGVDVVTRSRALRAPPWAIGAAALVLLSDGYWGGILRSLVVKLLEAT
jgi:hypothetical protein